MLSLSSLHVCMCCPRLPVYRPCRTHCVHLPYISQYGKCVLNCNGWTTSLRRYTESAFFRVDDGTHLRRRRGTLSNRRRFLPVYFPKGKVKTACLDFPRGSGLSRVILRRCATCQREPGRKGRSCKLQVMGSLELTLKLRFGTGNELETVLCFHHV